MEEPVLHVVADVPRGAAEIALISERARQRLFVKKGTKSVGVQRQYSGTAGRIENCRLGFSRRRQSTRPRADRPCPLPARGPGPGSDPAGAAGVPENTVFTSKPDLGRRILARAFAAEGAMPMGDRRRVYGADDVLRRCIERGDRGYVLARPAGSGWGSRRWRTGSRKLAHPEAFIFSLTLAPEAAGLPGLVRMAGTRWTIAACFEGAKGEVGLDQYEVRPGPAGIAISRWRCWRMPISPCFAARRAEKGALDLNADLLPLTVPEVRRLLWPLVRDRLPDHEAACAWSRWRRRHQQRGWQSHGKRRTSTKIRP